MSVRKIRIQEAKINTIFDSRGKPTVKIRMILDDGHWEGGAAPSGASVGEHEVKAYPEGGIDTSVEIFKRDIAFRLEGAEPDFSAVDRMLREIDGTENFSRIGGNLAVAISIATARAEAWQHGIPLWQLLNNVLRDQFSIDRRVDRLPRPLGNVIGGGVHAVGGTHIQEFLSVGFSSHPFDNIETNAAVHAQVKNETLAILPGATIGKGDEGAWNLPFTDEVAFEIAHRAIEKVKEGREYDIRLGVDFAASELWDQERGLYVFKNGETRTPAQQIDYIEGLIQKHHLVYVEDPLEENDFKGTGELVVKKDHNWETANYGACARFCSVSRAHMSLIMNGHRRPSLKVARKISRFFNMTLDDLCSELEMRTKYGHKVKGTTGETGHDVLICGDDLFVTNPKRLQQGIDVGAANTILLKVNQIGTISQTIETAALAIKNHYFLVVSHRSGETTDPAIADLAVGLRADFIKTGAVGGERTRKLNRLIEIAEDLRERGQYSVL